MDNKKSLLARFGTHRLVAAALALACVAYLAVALQLPTGSIRRPGSGFFPQVTAVLGITLALGAALLARPHTVAPPECTALWFSAALFAFCALLQPLGFIPAGILFTGLLAWLLGAANTRQIAAVALPTPLVLHVIFVRAFDITLPRGLLAGLI